MDQDPQGTSRWGIAKSAGKIGVLVCLSLFLFGGSVASAHHDGHEDALGGGRIPGQPDFKKVGETTTRFLPEKRIYKITRPGEPPQFMHADAPYEPGVGGWVPLPSNELAPICRNSNNRIIINYDGPDPVPVDRIRSVVRRMNWKIADQSSRSSGGSRVVRMAVECDATGQIAIYHYTYSKVQEVFKSPEGLQAVKVLTYKADCCRGAGPISIGNEKSRQNPNARYTSYPWMSDEFEGWSTHNPMHELFHSMGATQATEVTPKAPYATEWSAAVANGFHCVDGWDVMCYADGAPSDYGTYSETRCPASGGFDTPDLVPLDCGNDTYFDSAPTPGTYLANYWNIGQVENPYLSAVPSSPPTATTDPATDVKLTTVKINGTATPRGDYSTYYFEWGPTASYGNKTALTDAGSGNTPLAVSKELSGLQRETTYHYRLVVTNDAGTTYGVDRTVVTTPAPQVSTVEAKNITTTTATLVGTVNPEGLSTAYQFEWGPTTAYGFVRPIPAKALVSNFGNFTVTQAIDGLVPGTTYHYRVVASNAFVSGVGSDKTFTAKDVAPSLASFFGSSGSGEGQFEFPRGIALDSAGNIWVADGANDRIQKFDSKGQFVSQFGSSGTGNGQFDTPVDIAIDAGGNLWVTDAGNARVQKFGPAGNYLGQFGKEGLGPGEFAEPSGIAVDSGGNLWVSDHLYSRVEEFNSKGEYIRTAAGGPELVAPSGVAVDGQGDVWVADMSGNKLVEYSSAGQYKSHFGSAGAGNGQLSGPGELDVTSAGNLVVAEREPGRVQEFSQAGEYLTQFGGGQMAEPGGIAVGSDRAIYVSNSRYLNRVEKWQQQPPDASTSAATNLTGSQAMLNGSVNAKGLPTTYFFEYGTTVAYGAKAPTSPAGAGAGSEAVQVSEIINGLKPATTYHYRVVAGNSAGSVTYGTDKTFKTKAQTRFLTTSFGSSGSDKGQFNFPRGIAIIQSVGYLWVADGSNDRVQKFTSNGEYLDQFGSTGTGNGQFHVPTDVAIDSGGNLWVTDGLNGRVEKFSSTGSYVSQFGSGQLVEASGIAIDSGGNLWVSDHASGTLRKFNTKGEILATAAGGPGLVAPAGVAVDPQNDVWVTDMGENRVVEYSSSGQYKSSFGSWGAESGQFEEPSIIDFTPDGTLLVGDRYTGRVQEFTQAGEYLTQFGALAEPGGIAVASGGPVYVSNSLYINKVEKWVQAPLPTVTAQAASAVTKTGATLNGTVTPGGLAATYHFEYGPTTAYGTSVPVPDKSAGSSGSVEAAQAISGLAPNTTYHYRVVATNAEGMARSQDRTFTTQAIPPLATTDGVSGLSAEGATLRATINPEGFDTAYWFEYGKTNAYGMRVPAAEKSAGSGSSAVAVSETVGGLEPGQTYHFRVVASSGQGNAYGNDLTFTPSRLSGLAVTEPFDGSTSSLAGFAGNWSALGWASGGTPKGEDTTSGWRPLSAFPTANGTFYGTSVSDSGSGIAAVVTMAATPLISGRYFSVWLDMPTPAGQKGGYELRFTCISASEFDVTLSRWQGGVQSELVKKSSVSFAAGSSLALVDQAGTVSAWTDAGSGFSQLLSAADSTFSSGNAGLEGSGSTTRLGNFKLGGL